MTNWAATNKATGDVQYLKGLGGVDPEIWDVVPIAREPGEGDDFRDGRLVKDKEQGERARGRSTIGHLTLDELTALIDARIAQSGG